MGCGGHRAGRIVKSANKRASGTPTKYSYSCKQRTPFGHHPDLIRVHPPYNYCNTIPITCFTAALELGTNNEQKLSENPCTQIMRIIYWVGKFVILSILSDP